MGSGEEYSWYTPALVVPNLAGARGGFRADYSLLNLMKHSLGVEIVRLSEV
jgi:hypothetical protein